MRVLGEFQIIIPGAEEDFYQAIKSLDRSFTILSLYFQQLDFIVVAFVCFRFCVKFGILGSKAKIISSIAFILHISLVSIIYIGIAIIFGVQSLFPFSVKSKDDTSEKDWSWLLLFVPAVFLMGITIISTLVMVNIFGWKATLYLKQSQKVIKKMLDSMGESIIHNTSSVYESYKLKRNMMIKIMILHYGISITLILEIIANSFVPLAIFWEYFLVLFHFFNTISELVFVVLILFTFHPLKELHEFTEGIRRRASSAKKDPTLTINYI